MNGDDHSTQDTGNSGTIIRVKKRRGVRYVSRVDQEILALGGTPSWQVEDRSSHATNAVGGTGRPVDAQSCRVHKPRTSSSISRDDQRYLEDLPPHWHPHNQ